MWLFKISTISAIVLNGLLIPFYVILYYYLRFADPLLFVQLRPVFYITSYAAVISLIFFICLAAVRIRSGYKGTRLMIGNRHLHEGTIGFVFVFIGTIWNMWHYFDTSFQIVNYTLGWYLAIGGLVWIVIGAIFIGRDWEDIKKGKFFNKEEK
ncbi:MAG: hypothetical protein HWN65_12650 [Candidatus Helarchaeota archaeon]|nr:hypothetical protein [Candidatus Helarchaeota archaeon]